MSRRWWLPTFRVRTALGVVITGAVAVGVMSGASQFVALTLAGLIAGPLLAAAGGIFAVLGVAATLRMSCLGFCRDADDDILVRTDPRLAGRSDITALRTGCRQEMADLDRRFGRPIQRRVRVIVFADRRWIRFLLGREYLAAAFPPLRTVALAGDVYDPEHLRHELVHLYAARWNLLAPKLLSEGLAVFLQADDSGHLVDRAVQRLALSSRPRLRDLLGARYLLAGERLGERYLLAGSFAGFLMRRLGWDGFRRLYTTSFPWNAGRSIERSLGMDLEEAEWRWLAELDTIRVLRDRLERELQ